MGADISGKLLDEYRAFLATKIHASVAYGKPVQDSDIHPRLFPFQRDVTRWAVGKGRCAVLLDTGLGKTNVQLEWARLIGERTLIFAPLSVARQTVREAQKIDLEVRYVRSQAEVTGDHKIWITNYEMLDAFDLSQFGAVVLDESSVLKSLSGITRRKLTEACAAIPYRLCCSATPAPNDYTELGNHAHFLGICTTAEMLSMFFINANRQQAFEVGGKVYEKKGSNKGGQEWRLKHHAEDRFFQWLSTWAITMTKPSDLGYEDDGFILPPLNVEPVFVKADIQPGDEMFFTGLKGLGQRADVRRQSLAPRLAKLREVIDAKPGEQWIVWVGLDEESKAVAAMFPDAVEVEGSHSAEYKAQAFEGFEDGKHRILLTKSKIGGLGMNFQCASNMAFLGLSDSWESYYQAVRREWRYGQQRPVKVHIIMSEAEDAIYHNVMRKDAMATRLRHKLIEAMRDYERGELGMVQPLEQAYEQSEASGKGWRILLGDSCERLKEIDSDSVDMSVYSPPFQDLFTYSASDRDLGNSRGTEQFFAHYAYIIREVLRVTKPGRLTCVHTSDIPAMDSRDGWIGVKDFPGDVIRAYVREGWAFKGRAFIPKNPQAQAIRTHSQSLLFVQLRKDSTASRPALIDQVLIFEKPGINAVPVTPVDNGEMDNEMWIEWANGVWTGISESDTLQASVARDKDDEKHVCPLQLGTIERCIKLYSNPGELVLTPFLGIGSEAYMAVKLGRRAIGVELKPSYFQCAIKNLHDAEHLCSSADLFSFTGISIPASNGHAHPVEVG